MALTAWPQSTLGLPRITGYSFSNNAPLIRTEMQSGKVRQRRIASGDFKYLSVNFVFTDQNAAVFQSWVKYKIDEGAAQFTMNLKLGDGSKNYTVRIVNGDYSISYNNGRWNVQTLLELEDPAIMTEGALDAILP